MRRGSARLALSGGVPETSRLISPSL